jgi:hypothetical protein
MPTSVKIDFLVPGFSKCGTTTLCALLGMHPGIFIPKIKEPWYFSADDFERQHRHYEEHFAPSTKDQLKGEGSISYSGAEYEDTAVERIYTNNPDCKFIFIARNPRQRIESSYREMHHSGVQYGVNAPYALNECLTAFPQIIRDTLYWQRIGKYRHRFGDDSVLVLFLEELQDNVGACLCRCIEHLGLTPYDYSEVGKPRLNRGQDKLYDTRLLRYVRNNRYLGPRLARIGPFQQDKLLAPLKLRLAFGRRAIHWDEESQRRLRQEVYPDALAFLDFYGKDPSFWGVDSEG